MNGERQWWRALRSRYPKEFADAWIHLILAAVLTASIAQQTVTRARPLTYLHAWGAAGAAVDARAFRIAGIFALKGVPVHNNPPFGIHPAAYLHWPPLLALALTFWFSLWGESESAIHLFTLVVYLLTTGFLYWLLKVMVGRAGAAIGTLGWLALPVVVRYAHVVLNESLGFPFALFALIAFAHQKDSAHPARWKAGGVWAMVFAVLSSWQFLLVPVGLLAATLWNRSRPGTRVAAIYLLAGIVTALTVIAWYGLAYPALATDVFQAALYRMGLSHAYSTNAISGLGSTAPFLPFRSMVWSEARNLRWGLGATAWMALAAVLISQLRHWQARLNGTSLTVFCGLVAPPLLWFPLFMNHAAIHEFVTILLAPAAAFAMAWCGTLLLDALGSFGTARATALIRTLILAIPIALSLPLLRQVHRNVQISRAAGSLIPAVSPRPDIMEPDELVDFGRALRARTEPAAVVLTPEPSSVPLYYSWRHMIQGVTSEEDLNKLVPLIGTEFPSSPIYLALIRREESNFPSVPATATSGTRDPFLIVRLEAGPRSAQGK
ncbi:MAG TPA: glycosyltransferase family 39 protein [Candidatus Acidoferrales bacterium]|nr:glycosyltransferase family 39 protein [Candidatus Acidoferrales bacterium]